MAIQTFSIKDEEAGARLGIPGYVYRDAGSGSIFEIELRSSLPGHVIQAHDGRLFFVTDSAADRQLGATCLCRRIR